MHDVQKTYTELIELRVREKVAELMQLDRTAIARELAAQGYIPAAEFMMETFGLDLRKPHPAALA